MAQATDTEADTFRPKARVPKGFRDRLAGEVELEMEMIATLAALAARYGFSPLATSALEYADALGKFLPDQDRPNEGVYAFADEDGDWLALRYDHTAPLARLVAERFDALPRPFRRYAFGSVWRNEKPGPGRFREFLQFDVDSVGAPSMAADAELIAFLAEGLEAVGFARGDYILNVSNRFVAQAVMEAAGLDGADPALRLRVLRSIDKLDRLGIAGVRELLGPGRTDESGDFTKGAGLSAGQVDAIAGPLAASLAEGYTLARLRADIGGGATGARACDELEQIFACLDAFGIGPDRARVTTHVVRGIEYYTGPVFEAELTGTILGPDGAPMRIGSVGIGGRYDDLVMRFTGQTVPATGASLGISRLIAARLALAGEAEAAAGGTGVLVLVFDRDRLPDYVRMVRELREAGLPAELYLGGAGLKAQMKYADRRGAAVAVMEGGDEHARGEVTLKDLRLGAEMARSIADNREWRQARPAQETVARGDLVPAVRAILERSGAGGGA
ncbi:MAG: histidine--tRNA ligase [Alphaproteobacteria bacterium]|nr:histidine--tRNA ligase [Alphaproteobacteria bacterium]